MGVDPATFRTLLVHLDLAASRASELKAVLECPDVCRRFLRPSRGLTWRAALGLARDLGPNGRQLAARRLARLVFARNHFWTAGQTIHPVPDFWVMRVDEGGCHYELHHPSAAF